ncbi:hypothetical protein NFI95_03120 [Acetobacteraceae bacterium KSS8]|uniref:DNA-(apurinic or apyrimidinic site) lyase n=1 Tax=Endosaccharibacter trunci TaxID=2812733 RepID=A0ABT1W593_9PROT|nr:hypothetical protein [Acetobacteraceae bacterium KSS8]
MPEGHSVRRLADAFVARFQGHRVAASSPQGRFADGAAIIDGLTLSQVDAHGKQMFLRFGNEAWLRVHLGMYGMWRFHGEGLAGFGRESVVLSDASAPESYPPAPVGAVRLRLDTGRNIADLSGPSACVLMTPPEHDAFLAGLGEDPLREDADPAKAYAKINASRMPIAALLMRQDIVAGIGNLYRAELLFRARLEPHKPGRDLTRADWDALWRDGGELLREGVRLGRIVCTRPEDRPKRKGPVRREDSFYVAHRAGLPCRICGTPVRSETMAGRMLFWCETCQVG